MFLFRISECARNHQRLLLLTWSGTSTTATSPRYFYYQLLTASERVPKYEESRRVSVDEGFIFEILEDDEECIF